MTVACSHGMPSPASCIECMDEGNMPPAPKVAPVTIEATFAARYDGECPSCGDPIAVGDVVHKLSNGRYVHQGCE